MQKRTLGAHGPALSALGLGCNNFGMKLDADGTREVVSAALGEGITHFDTAEMYGEGASETFLGAALTGRRDEAVIATKFLPRGQDDPFRPGDLRRRVIEGAEGSLRRLGTDRIDVFYQHYPDPDAPVDELFEAMQTLLDAGKIRHAALSNTDADLVVAAGNVAATRPEFPLRGVQVEWNLLNRDVEREIVPAALGAGLGVIPYFPLASGLLTGKYNDPAGFPEGSRLATIPWFAEVATPENLATVARLIGVAEGHGRSVLELSVAWLLAQPGVSSVIAGATTAEQVRANVAAITWAMDRAVLAEIEEALAG